jgi:hypothetical protein
VIGIEKLAAFTGPAKVELLGLPPGVTTVAQEITPESTEVKFPLTVAQDARVGLHNQLFCQVTVIENGEPVVHLIGTGELRVEAPLPPPQTAQAPAATAGDAT